MIDRTLVVGPFQCNCRILACPETGEAVVVDPGDEPERILRAIAELKTPSGAPIRIRYLFHTHAHLDHIGGTRAVKQALVSSNAQPPRAPAHEPPMPDSRSSALIALHPADDPIYKALKMQGQLFGLSYEDPLPVEHWFEDNQELKVGTLRFTILHSPGHSPGSVGIRLHEDSQAKTRETLLSGDTLFQGSVGRTDLWGADQDAMFRSIRTRFFTLDDDTRVCPGHGPDSTIGREKRENPFFT